jgi:hypothetical protein
MPSGCVRIPTSFISITTSSACSGASLPRRLEAFSRELAALTPEALVARFNEAQKKELEELQAKADQEESDRFYNKPQARADFAHWSKAAPWTLDEAIALSFGRAPEIVRWEQLQKFTALGSPFVSEYARRRDLATRAVAWNQLYDPVLPGAGIAATI